MSGGALPAAGRPPHSPAARLAALALLLLLCLGTGWLGSLATAPAIEPWYRGLAKPAWTPPDAAFGIVWTVLYLLMAVAAWLVWLAAPPAAVRRPLGLFLLQLALNAAWSPLFFGLRSPGLALLDILLLLPAILATLLAFRRHSRAAAMLMAPYLLWVLYAAALNLAIWRLNP